MQRLVSAASPRGTFFGLALIGGSPGALLARRLFQRKTRKEPFSTNPLVIVALQTRAVIGSAITFA